MQAKAKGNRMYQFTPLTVKTASRTGLIQQIHHLVRSNQIPANRIGGCYYGMGEDIQIMIVSHTT